MALAPSSSPLYIAGISRVNGKVVIRITSHGFTIGQVGSAIRVTGVADPSFNVTSTVASVPDANTITFNQSSLNDRTVELVGGAVSVG